MACANTSCFLNECLSFKFLALRRTTIKVPSSESLSGFSVALDIGVDITWSTDIRNREEISKFQRFNTAVNASCQREPGDNEEYH